MSVTIQATREVHVLEFLDIKHTLGAVF